MTVLFGCLDIATPSKQKYECVVKKRPKQFSNAGGRIVRLRELIVQTKEEEKYNSMASEGSESLVTEGIEAQKMADKFTVGLVQMKSTTNKKRI